MIMHTENKKYEAWFLTGSQHLYGEETLKRVTSNAEEIVMYLNNEAKLPVQIIFKAVLTSPEQITNICREVNNHDQCIGIITWMHTFSPAKMWINGLKALRKPILHLHTQFNRDIPWETIDMDFMNLNQSAHGGREYGFIGSRLRIDRKIIVGHWQDEDVLRELNIWLRSARGWHDSQNLKIARFGDNMREVAVTEGDKVEAQIKFGYDVYGYGIGDLVKYVNDVTESQVNKLIQEYEEEYMITREVMRHQGNTLVEAARIELGMRTFLVEGHFKAFTTTFEDLHGLSQLPGLAVQRLMSDGYGFGAEGDWKTAALVRTVKVMAEGLNGGSSFMEDYTYHLDPAGKQVLGAHMLEICPSISAEKPKLEVHPLSIGGKTDPARLVFKASPGPAINISLIDMGNRFRVIVNEVNVVEVPELPKLPVARVLWEPKPKLDIAAAAWILAGGAHHTVFSQAITTPYIANFAEMAGVELIVIDEKTNISDIKKELRWNEAYYSLFK